MSTHLLSDTREAARRFHALSDETRLEIVGLLAGGERCVCDLAEALNAAQSRLSFHLRVLKTAGLVSDRKDGRWSYYSLNPEVLDGMAELVRSVQPEARPLDRAGPCCG